MLWTASCTGAEPAVKGWGRSKMGTLYECSKVVRHVLEVYEMFLRLFQAHRRFFQIQKLWES
jgi:hypothetical protein